MYNSCFFCRRYLATVHTKHFSGHSGYGADSGWFVKEVEVDVPSSGKKYYFPCNRWLAKEKEDGKVVRLLTASDTQLVTYKPREFTIFMFVVITIRNNENFYPLIHY